MLFVLFTTIVFFLIYIIIESYSSDIDTYKSPLVVVRVSKLVVLLFCETTSVINGPEFDSNRFRLVKIIERRVGQSGR